MLNFAARHGIAHVTDRDELSVGVGGERSLEKLRVWRIRFCLGKGWNGIGGSLNLSRLLFLVYGIWTGSFQPLLSFSAA
jgi:hypothetical protein